MQLSRVYPRPTDYGLGTFLKSSSDGPNVEAELRTPLDHRFPL